MNTTRPSPSKLSLGQSRFSYRSCVVHVLCGRSSRCRASPFPYSPTNVFILFSTFTVEGEVPRHTRAGQSRNSPFETRRIHPLVAGVATPSLSLACPSVCSCPSPTSRADHAQKAEQRPHLALARSPTTRLFCSRFWRVRVCVLLHRPSFPGIKAPPHRTKKKQRKVKKREERVTARRSRPHFASLLHIRLRFLRLCVDVCLLCFGLHEGPRSITPDHGCPPSTRPIRFPQDGDSCSTPANPNASLSMKPRACSRDLAYAVTVPFGAHTHARTRTSEGLLSLPLHRAPQPHPSASQQCRHTCKATAKRNIIRADPSTAEGASYTLHLAREQHRTSFILFRAAEEPSPRSCAVRGGVALPCDSQRHAQGSIHRPPYPSD